MPYLQVNDKQVQLQLGETRIGMGGQVEVRPSGAAPGLSPVLAIVDLGRDNHVAVRRASPDAVVRVNGVALGAEPTPLLHGDKIEVAGTELYYGDDRKGGSTQFIASANVADLARLRTPVSTPRATAVTGGRVISLVDGREYPVGPSGLVFGRDASCDVVIPSTEVSRHHAEIVPGDTGYVVTDNSTNGLFVNGERVEGMQILGRSDILKIGPEEFRFYADAAPPNAPSPPGSALRESAMPPAAAPVAGPASAFAAPNSAAAAPPPPPAAPAPLPAAGPLAPAPAAATAGSLAAAGAAGRGTVAMFEVVGSSVLRGEHYPVTALLAHLGRGEHNDVVIPEESVSDSHAKLQRRDGIWYITDVGSTNGTYVAGRRITGEERLGTAAELRLGGVKLTFTTLASEPTTGPRGATRELSGPADDAERPARVSRPAGVVEPAVARGKAPAPSRPTFSPEPPSSGTGAMWVWAVVVAAVVIVALTYFLKSR